MAMNGTTPLRLADDWLDSPEGSAVLSMDWGTREPPALSVTDASGTAALTIGDRWSSGGAATLVGDYWWTKPATSSSWYVSPLQPSKIRLNLSEVEKLRAAAKKDKALREVLQKFTGHIEIEVDFA